MSATADKGATEDAQLASKMAEESLKDPQKTSEAADELANGANEGEDEDEEDEGDDVATAEGGAEQLPKSKKKKKPKKKKKAAATTEGGEASHGSAIAQASQTPMPAQGIQEMLKQLALQTPDARKNEGKAPGDYKFWNTQPVPKFQEPNLLQTTEGKEGKTLPEGAILPDEVCRASAKAEPEKLLEGFEWCLVDLEDSSEQQELYDLLYNHYVEDTEGSFRFNYSIEFLNWALKPPGWRKEWHIGVRTKTGDASKKGKLVAFIAGTPAGLNVRTTPINTVEINFLVIHRKLRSKRLAPVLIKEVTRQCYRNGIYQALYTAGTLLPTPVSTCRYFHRSLDWPHLNRTGFSHLPMRSTESMQVRKYFLPSKTATKGLRQMQKADVPAVKDLLTRYLARFQLRQTFTEDEIEHFLCSDSSKGVVYAYVVEQDNKITDLLSFYLLDSTVLKSNSRNETIRAAYLYYYASEAAFSKPSDPTAELKPRLDALMHDALILAKNAGFHVFNALTLLDNPLFLKDAKFEPGDGKLHFYLFNWRTPRLGGGVDEKNQIDVNRMGGVGVVML